MDEAIAEAKKDTEVNAQPAKKHDHSHEVAKSEETPKAPTASDLPPELAGELETKPAFAQTRHAAYESDSDSDSSDSDSDDEWTMSAATTACTDDCYRPKNYCIII